jgi:hypothetical protein
MNCNLNNWGCVFHACMTNDCQIRQVEKNYPECMQEWMEMKPKECKKKQLNIRTNELRSKK